MSNKNMIIWDQVQKSDPDSVKAVSFGRKFNAINAQHQVKRATEVFGPIGKGWGVSNEFFSFPIPGLLMYNAEMWYNLDGEGACVFSISASIMTHSASGKLDDECAKKVQTDAMTKGLSKLGFNADVFLGLWDDNKYVNSVKADAVKASEVQEPAKAIKPANVVDIKAEVIKLKRKANEFAKKGDPDGIRKLWADNKQLHKVDGLQAAIINYGQRAVERMDANKSKDGEEKAEG